MRLLPRRFPPTREGWWFLVSTLLIGAAAVNGGINLLFLVFGMMLFLILASGVMSELGLRHLAVARRPPATIHAGSPYLMGVSVRNDKKRLPTFSLEVEDLIGDKPVDRRCYYLKLPASRMQETAYRHTLYRRGVHQLTGFRISTRFPFGLIRKSRDMDARTELLVYPALVPLPQDLIPTGPAQNGQRVATRPSRSGDFYGLREFREGDDPRDIHWRTSARRGRPFVRECEDDSGRTALVVLEGGSADGDAAFEAAVSMAASIAVALVKRGFQVGLETATTSVVPGHGPNQMAHILKVLALVKAEAATGPRRGGARSQSDATCFRISPGQVTPRVQVDKGDTRNLGRAS